MVWGNDWYDFQGGCDQIAIVNPILELQIRTRPRGGYSAITQVALFMKKSGEIFRIRDDGAKEVTITKASKAIYSTSDGTHRIDLDSPSGDSFILVHESWSGFSIQVHGQGHVFTDSEGMCGSWNFGGVRFRNGNTFDLSGSYDDKLAKSFDLASSWKVPLSKSLMWNPTETCDASSLCGQGKAFQCSDSRRLHAESRHLQDPSCDRKCSDITILQAKEQCEKDVEITGDNSWACTPNYLNPIIGESIETSTTTTTATTQAITTTTTVTQGSGLYYADWLGLDTCVNDGKEPLYMQKNPTTWMFSTLDECCKKHYGYKLAECKGAANDRSGLYYPNWKNNAIEQCINDGNEPNYMSNNPSAWMHETVESCE